MKKVLFLAIVVLISIVITSCHRNCQITQSSTMDSLWKRHTLYECITLKGTESNVNIHVKKGEKPEGVFGCGGNFFWVAFTDIDAPDKVEIPKRAPEDPYDKIKIRKIKRSFIVLLQEGETVDFIGKLGFIIRTSDRAIKVRYIYEE